MGGYSSGVIILTGLGTPGLLNDGLCLGLKGYLARDVRVMCPSSPDGFGLFNGNEWFRASGLPAAVRLVESYIREMADHGIPSERVVLAGLSQGGALTFYTALNTRYRILKSQSSESTGWPLTNGQMRGLASCRGWAAQLQETVRIR